MDSGILRIKTVRSFVLSTVRGLEFYVMSHFSKFSSAIEIVCNVAEGMSKEVEVIKGLVLLMQH